VDKGICKVINLDVPYFKQHNLVTCGPYCVKMVLSYLGIEKSIGEICESCNYCSQGTLETGLVLGLRSMGVDSVLHMVPDGDTIKAKYVSMDVKKLATTLRRRGGRSRKEVIKRGFSELAQVVENEQLDFRLPTRDLIERNIEIGNPWIVVVKPFALYGFQDDKKASLLHFVVIGGYDENGFYINDPATELRYVWKDQLLYGMYSGECRAICIRKK